MKTVGVTLVKSSLLRLEGFDFRADPREEQPSSEISQPDRLTGAPDPVAPDSLAPDTLTSDPVALTLWSPDRVAPEPLTPDPVTHDPVAPDPLAPDPVAPGSVPLACSVIHQQHEAREVS
ncbi:hypothetical protein EYF80_044838 [Liparis tanakae]|uniref:Uncharacterized protein n=1 Tax=Liparis tanakae TaxID=230148 RepID=A0A4Z2FWL1_9TELE|nr:hypothetical protein EYF80_044838 [Liparis tanakae]